MKKTFSKEKLFDRTPRVFKRDATEVRFLLGGIGFLAVLPLSCYRQKRIILAEEAEKERLRKIEREFKRQAVIKNVVDKVKADDYSRFMPKAENREA